MDYEFLIETPESPLEVIAKSYLSECGISSLYRVVVKKDCGHFYFLNKINTNSKMTIHENLNSGYSSNFYKNEIDNSDCLDFIDIDIPKNSFLKRLHFWNHDMKNPITPVFDPKSLAILTEQINFEWTKKILHSFIETIEKQMPLLKNALEEKNIAQLSKTAHYLKSSCLVVGALDLHSFCEVCLEKTKYNEPWTRHLTNKLLDIEFAINSTRGSL